MWDQGSHGNFLFPGEPVLQNPFYSIKMLDINAVVESCMQLLSYVNFLFYRRNYKCWACMTGRAELLKATQTNSYE